MEEKMHDNASNALGKLMGLQAKDAEVQSAAILDEALRQADKMKEDRAQNLKLRSQDMMSKLEKEGEEQLKAAEKAASEEVLTLKQQVEPKKKEAVKAVISLLI